MLKLGTEYGGWAVPKDMVLGKNSTVISVGVGEDISFDLLLNAHFNCDIILVDPTSRAVRHVEEIREFYNTKVWKFSGNIQADYKRHIENLNVDFRKFKYIEKALWNSETALRFYKQTNPNYVSQTLIPDMYGNNYDEVPTTTLRNIMDANSLSSVDMIKLDIEGSEIEVLNDMLDSDIFPTYVLVEFDLKLKGKDSSNRTEAVVNRLHASGYSILHNDNYNITFKRR
jgi:FkbM family methyltransferase